MNWYGNYEHKPISGYLPSDCPGCALGVPRQRVINMRVPGGDVLMKSLEEAGPVHMTSGNDRYTGYIRSAQVEWHGGGTAIAKIEYVVTKVEPLDEVTLRVKIQKRRAFTGLSENLDSGQGELFT